MERGENESEMVKESDREKRREFKEGERGSNLKGGLRRVRG
jgi:hypothetical protein